MSAVQLLEELRAKGIHLWDEGGALRFKAPRGALTSDLRARIADQRTPLLDALAELPVVIPAPEQRGEPFPLTDLQQAYWVGRGAGLELGSLGPKSYLELDWEELDLPRFEHAWQRVVERHDMLRAVVRRDGFQQVLPQVPAYRIAVLDLRHLPAVAAEQAAGEVREAMLAAVHPPDRWPLFELRVTIFGPRRQRLHIARDLLIGDARSSQILMRDILVFYRDPWARLPPLALRYRDYVLAQRRHDGGAADEAARRHWARRLATLPPPPELPAGASAGREHRLCQREGELAAAVWAAAKRRAASAGITPSALLCAAFAEVLAVWARRSSFTLNLLFSHRPPVHPEVDELVGNFASTLLLAVEPSGANFASRARALQERLWEDLPHHRHNGVRVLRDLNRSRSYQGRLTMPIVFSSALPLAGPAVDTAGGGDGDAGAPDAAPPARLVFSSLQTPQVLLEVLATESAGRLWFAWNEVLGAFPSGLVAAMFGAFATLLRRLGTGEDAWTDQRLQLVPPEQLAVRAAVNDTAKAVSDELLHEAFFRHAILAPGAPAVLDTRRELSYGELAALASALAHRLAARGVQANELVAVVLEKGWQQAVATLGVLAAGAAYVPLDPGLPRERLWHLLATTRTRIALTSAALRTALSWPQEIEVQAVEAVEQASRDSVAAGTPPPTPAASADDLAYVIFTSGSTGLPKGVMIDHRGAVNTVLDINRRFAIGGGDRVLALSSLSFDLSVWDLFGVLGAGGAVVMPEPAAQPRPRDWVRLAAERRVTVWNSVPALLELALDEMARGDGLPPDLRLVMLSGDWIAVSLPDRLWALAPVDRRPHIVSLGGATEASIWSIQFPISRVAPGWRTIPYGRPLANQTVHVLDERLEPRPDWVPGMLYLGGVGLARGYWRDEAKSRASFIQHPVMGERLYRTGDLGRWLPNGTVELLGREDLQVKVNGYRIELGEVEATLALHPLVREAIVTAAGEQAAARRLLAHVVCQPAEEGAAAGGQASGLAAADLRAFLAAKLPEYMVPAVYAFLPALPLTANGKVDRAALAAPSSPRLPTAAASDPPATATEAALAGIWEEALAVRPIGIADSFFALGGDSMLALQVTRRVERQLGYPLALGEVFEHPTVRAMAALVDGAVASPAPTPASAAEHGRSPLVRLRPGGRPFHCVHPIGGGVLCYADLARLLPGTELWGLQARGLEAGEEPLTSVAAMADRYAASLAAAAPGPYRLGGWSMGGVVALAMARRLCDLGRQVQVVVMIDSLPVYGDGQAGAAMGEDELLAAFARDLGLLGRGAAGILPAGALGDKLAALLTEGRRRGTLPTEMSAAVLTRLFRVFRAHGQALRRHRPRPWPGPTVLLRAAEQPPELTLAPDLGWSAALGQPIEVLTLPGDHHSLVREPAAQQLAQALLQILKRSADA